MPEKKQPPCETMVPIDHDVLDLIASCLDDTPAYAGKVSRESECIEFVDPRDGWRYEIVVRALDPE